MSILFTRLPFRDATLGKLCGIQFVEWSRRGHLSGFVNHHRTRGFPPYVVGRPDFCNDLRILFNHVLFLARIGFHVEQFNVVDESKALITNTEIFPLKLIRFLACGPSPDMRIEETIGP